MRGRVVAGGREAVIGLRVSGRESAADVEVEAVIDTGFTGHLTLPPDVVRALSLPVRGSVDAELADGGTTTLTVYDALVLWHDRRRRVPVYGSDGAAFVGMALLRGSTLTVEVMPGGAVEIVETGQGART
jgi:clan AA aspartic protease